MKNILALTALALGLACTTANAASLKSTPTTPGAANYAVYIDSEATIYDVIELTITPLSGVSFANIGSGLNAGVPRGPNENFTFRNRVLDADPLDGGRGWSFPGQTINATTYTWVGGPNPAIPITTATEPGGRLFLGNVSITGQSPAATRPGHVANVSVNLIANGITVQTITGMLSAPEPASFGMAGIAAIAGLAFRRRRAA
jgi:hypothetical protein